MSKLLRRFPLECSAACAKTTV